MTSQLQIDANRRNARLSTGPKTPEGKRRSGGNAIRHGIYAGGSVLPHENLAAYNETVEQFHADLSPVGQIELSLVDRLADLWWRMGRTAAMEAGLLSPDPAGGSLNEQVMRARRERELALHYMGEETPEPQPQTAADFIRLDAQTPPRLDLLSRYEGRLEKSFERLLAMLERRQAARRRQSQLTKNAGLENKQ